MKNQSKLIFNDLSFERAKFFFDLRKEEIEKCLTLYPKKNAYSLIKYYNNLWNKSNQYTNYIRLIYSLRIMHLVKNISKDIKVLDAGCGTGSESIICAMLGGNVKGIDLSRDRLDIANLRINYYQNLINKKLNIMFTEGNIFDQNEQFDLIWANESISHIHSFEKFLKFAYNNLVENGKLIIADENNLNPYIYYKNKLSQKKKGGIYIKKLDPRTNKFIPYAVERCFSIIDIKKLTSKLFKLKSLIPLGYIPYFLYNLMGSRLFLFGKIILQYFPIINKFSASYVIILMKN